MPTTVYKYDGVSDGQRLHGVVLGDNSLDAARRVANLHGKVWLDWSEFTMWTDDKGRHDPVIKHPGPLPKKPKVIAGTNVQPPRTLKEAPVADIRTPEKKEKAPEAATVQPKDDEEYIDLMKTGLYVVDGGE